jgi:cob(I)alamin adenosyltransferase
MSEGNTVYTRGGDQGDTSLIGGDRVPKYHQKIEAYGTIDELNSFIGLVRDYNTIVPEANNTIIYIQNILFNIESKLASTDKDIRDAMPEVLALDIELLESEIDKMNAELPVLKNFILPGGHKLVSYTHVARTVCRRGERLMVKLLSSDDIDSNSVKFINRLSDYFFVLGRKFSHELKVKESIWIANPRESTK